MSAATVTVHHPAKPGSTIVVTAKAYGAVYAAEGFVMGREGAPTADANGVAALEAELREARARLAELERPERTTFPPGDLALTLTPPAVPQRQGEEVVTNALAPRKRGPRTRTRKAAATEAPAAPPVELAPGPADIGSTSLQD